jgi:hypothetical protein
MGGYRQRERQSHEGDRFESDMGQKSLLLHDRGDTPRSLSSPLGFLMNASSVVPSSRANFGRVAVAVIEVEPDFILFPESMLEVSLRHRLVAVAAMLIRETAEL